MLDAKDVATPLLCTKRFTIAAISPPTQLSKRGPDEQNFDSTPFPVQRKLLNSTSKIQYSGSDRTKGLAWDRSAHTVSYCCL